MSALHWATGHGLSASEVATSEGTSRLTSDDPRFVASPSGITHRHGGDREAS